MKFLTEDERKVKDYYLLNSFCQFLTVWFLSPITITLPVHLSVKKDKTHRLEKSKMLEPLVKPHYQNSISVILLTMRSGDLILELPYKGFYFP